MAKCQRPRQAREIASRRATPTLAKKKLLFCPSDAKVVLGARAERETAHETRYK